LERNRLNPARKAAWGKKYRATEKGKKTDTQACWRSRGLCPILNDIDAVFERWKDTKTCDLCGVELTDGNPTTSTTKCMDHDHYTKLFRNILCSRCNSTIPNQPEQKEDIISPE
jgi:hypothetical protein